jgi:hypothetical protein
VISSRTGAVLALMLSLAAVALAVVAFMATLRDETEQPGRLVQTRLTQDYAGEPQIFPVDDFYIGPSSQGALRAFYVYPPGFFGHQRGCRIVWDASATTETPEGTEGPGLYVDPCSGARFNRDGELVEGPADRGLDEFATGPSPEGIVVDTRDLLCGAFYTLPVVAASAGEPSAAGPAVGITVPAPGAPTLTFTPTSTLTRTATPTPSPTPTPNERDECERVSPNSRRR